MPASISAYDLIPLGSRSQRERALKWWAVLGDVSSDDVSGLVSLASVLDLVHVRRLGLDDREDALPAQSQALTSSVAMIGFGALRTPVPSTLATISTSGASPSMDTRDYQNVDSLIGSKLLRTRPPRGE